MSESLFPGHEAAAPNAQGWHIAHCDGGSRGNPGPAGYGAVIEDPKGRVVARLSEYLGRQTNNYAEYQALLAVLKWANENGATYLRVISDSELMVNQMKGRYKVASPGLRPLWEEARRRAARLERFEMRHTLRGGNQEADRLANDAMDKGVGKAAPPAAVNPAASKEIPPRPDAQPKPKTQILEGFVKNGVVHLLEGELPDGIFVKIVRE
jgi:probable phosphoglycerate mutase